MNLESFLFIVKLNSIRINMGAPLIAIETPEWPSGIEIIDVTIETPETIHTKNGFTFDGKRVIVYIRDYNDYYGKPKFHICNCQTLTAFQNRNAYTKYVATNRFDGLFELNIIDGFGKKITSKTDKLEVCKNCLWKLNYKDYRNADYLEQNEIYIEFNLKEYLENGLRQEPVLPIHTASTSPINTYTKDFHLLAKWIKEQKHWTCEQCHKNYAMDKQNLHIHHKNEMKYDNNPVNLEVLCMDCHQSRHSHKIAI